MPIPALAVAGIGAVGGGVLGALGANEANRKRKEMMKYLANFTRRTETDIQKFEDAGNRRIQAQSADIISMTQRRGAAVGASMGRQGVKGTLGARVASGVRHSGAKAVATHESKAFPALGEIVATRRNDLRKQSLAFLAQLGPEQSIGFGALQGFTQALPGAADLYENINESRK